MARTKYVHHGLKGWSPDQYPFAGDPDNGMAVSWCGERTLHKRAVPFESLRLTTCTKCAQKIAAAKMARMPGRVRLERTGEPLPYCRSTYALWLDGVHRGWIGVDNGWGKSWWAASLQDASGYGGDYRGTGERVTGRQAPSHYTAADWAKRGESHDFWPVHHACKEALAIACLALFERRPSAFPTQEERDAWEVERKRQAEADRVERERLSAQYKRDAEERQRVVDERRNTWAEAHASLCARGDLSNLELAGLEAARLLIGGS